MRKAIRYLSIAFLGCFVNASNAFGGGKSSKFVSTNMSLSDLIKKLLSDGKADVLYSDRNEKSEALAIEPNVPDRELVVPEEENEDGGYRQVSLMLALNEKAHNIPTELVFYADKTSGQDREDITIKTNLKGRALTVAKTTGKVGVKDSAVVTVLDKDSSFVKARLRKELDFWLKGKGRKKKPESAKSSNY